MNDPVVASADVDTVALQRLRRFGGDKLVREMAALFIAHAPSRLAAARDGLTRRDAPTVKAALHALKSSAGQIGASRMHRLCEEGEQQAAAGDLSSMPSIVDGLDEELPRVTQWLLQTAGEAA